MFPSPAGGSPQILPPSLTGAGAPSGDAGGLGLGDSRDTMGPGGWPAAGGLSVGMIRVFLLPPGCKDSHGERAELPRGCSKAVAPGMMAGGFQPTSPWGRRGQWGDLGYFCLTSVPPAKLDLGAGRNACIHGWWCPAPLWLRAPQCWARRGIGGATAPSCLGEPGVLWGPLCPKATLSRWICFACAIPLENPVFKPSLANPPGWAVE